jgi:hypothetical protein
MSTSNETSSVQPDIPAVESPPVAQAVTQAVTQDTADSPVAESKPIARDNDSSPSVETPPDPQAVAETVTEIATRLTEENTYLITRIVNEIGVERSLQILEKSVEIEAGEGIMTRDGKRRRTPGGVFFFLVRGRISRDQYFKIWERPQPFYRSKKPQPPPPPQKRTPPPKKKKAEPLRWAARLALFNEVGGEHGQVSNAEVKLIGRPIKVLPRGNVVILTLRNRDQPPLPRSLPQVEDDPTVFLVFLTLKQWQKIADSMEEASDKVIVTGYPVFSGKLNAIAVWAQRATTVNMEKARHAAKKN